MTSVALKQDSTQALSLKEKTERELLQGLNPIQRTAVTHQKGPLLIVAGAGSGKTRVITHRIAYLIQIHDIAPWNIAAVTFTNKAAQEMRSRLESLIGLKARHVFVRTFHSLGLYVLSRHPESLGLKSGFSIVDQNGQKSLLKTILKEEGLEQDSMHPVALAAQINKARDAMLSPQALAKFDDHYSQQAAHIYKLYIQRLRKTNSVDFGDLLYETARLFQKVPELHQHYCRLWRYFLIDEYQDTNRVQYLLGRMIAREHGNIMVVGDDDQSIYSWRGADIHNILSFEKDYPQTQILKLEENYRSTPMILKAASSLIAKNGQRRPKTLFTTRDQNDTPIFSQTYTDETDEARGVVQQIITYRAQNISLNQMAIFYRTNAQSRVFERLLRESNLPYIIVGDIRFYERKEIKDFLAYLSVIVNPRDDLSLTRIINVPARGIGQTGLGRLQALAAKKQQSLLASLPAARDIPNFRSHQKVKALYDLFDGWHRLHLAGERPATIAERVLDESGYLAALKSDPSYESDGRVENLYEFLASLREYERECEEGIASAYDDTNDNPEDFGSQEESKQVQPGLSDFLQRIAIYTDEKSDDVPKDSCLYLMTLHNAKGLEFSCVFLCGVEEGYLPHSLAVEEGGTEEERRLLYVGITRARDYLHLSHAHHRWIFGNLQPRQASHFLNEIDPVVFAKQVEPSSASLISKEFEKESSYTPGEQVQHARYGRGLVLKAEKLPVGQKLTICFDDGSKNRLFLSQYTPLKKL